MQNDMICQHCGWASSIRPPQTTPRPQPSRPVRFAMKCLGNVGRSGDCRRVRVFSYLEVDRGDSVLSEVAPLLPTYRFIREMSQYRGRRQKIADLLISACDLHMFGLLETNPDSRDAAYAGAAFHLRKAAELFLRRVIVQERNYPPQFSIRQLLDRLKQSPPTLRKGARGAQLARSLQFIFDIGDVAAHTEVSNPRLRWLKYTRPATDGTIRRSISNFERVAGGVKWK